MAKPHNEPPNVSTYSDHEVIRPHHRLKGALRVTAGGSSPDLDAIARAEAALAELSSEFAGWMKAECDRLDASRIRVRETGLSGDAREEIFRAAHDIKGQAATFGYPLAAEAAESLCRLLEHVPDVSRIPLALIDQHVDGVRAIIREDVRSSGNAVAEALARSLRQVTEEFLAPENRHRPEYLETVTGPPLAPKA